MINKIVKFTGIKYQIINEIGVYPLLNNPEQLKLNKQVTKIQYKKLIQLKAFVQKYLDSVTVNEKINVSSVTDVAEYLIKFFKTLQDKERFILLCLDRSNNLISTDIVFVGTIGECAIYKRELIKIALLKNARSVIIAHNHPSGHSEPSDADIAVHKQVKNALNAVRIKYLDNFIITLNGYESFQQKMIF